MSRVRRGRVWLTWEQRVLAMALGGGAPALAAALYLLWSGGAVPRVQWTVTLVLVGIWLGVGYSLRRRVVLPLQTLSNLLAGLREGDASFRARGARADDALGEVMLEANTLAATIREQRLDALEATVLLRRVMAEIDVAVFAFDASNRLRLVNRAGERLLARPAERLLGSEANAIGLDRCLDADAPRVIEATFPGGTGRWEARPSAFRLGGLPHRLLVLADVSRPLRDEERQAWQRLMRVLGHEINNSLAPIKSIAGSLENLLAGLPVAGEHGDDMRRGLGVIASRAEALGRFTAAYSKLARLPSPRLEPVALGPLIERVVGLDSRAPVTLDRGPAVSLRADPDQIEQLLINVVKNAIDAAVETGGGVEVGWTLSGGDVEVSVTDEGPGIAQTGNLFVPFFTTKPGGSGIGLVLGRQIAEAHGGTLVLQQRGDRSGCVARLRLPAGKPPPARAR